jgi:uncharacterized membrane protein YfcA
VIFLLLALLVVIGSVLQGLVGFGQGLVIAPLVLATLGPGRGLTALTCLGLGLNLGLLLAEPRGERRFSPRLLLWAPVGVAVGTVVARSLPAAPLEIATGVLAVALAIPLLIVRPRVRAFPALLSIAGGMAGCLQAATTLSGPPLVLALSVERRTPGEARSLLFSTFLVLGVTALIAYLVVGLSSAQGALLGCAAIPLALLGGWLGKRAAHRLPASGYRALLLMAVIGAGVSAILLTVLR